MKKLKVLSLDGGGVRGLITATILKEIEKDLKVSIFEEFDLFCGTSTGGLIALHLALYGSKAEECASLYSKENLDQIFNHSFWDKKLPFQTCPKFDGKGKLKVLNEVFGGKTLGEAKKDVMITSYDIVNQKGVVFKSFGGDDHGPEQKVVTVADATSAAPTYFPTVETKESPSRFLVDGGIMANDPSMVGVSEAIKRSNLGEGASSLEEIYVLSIGTGHPQKNMKKSRKKAEESKDWGVEWVANGLVDHLFAGNTSAAEYHAKMLIGDNYLKVNGLLDEDSQSMDNVDSENLKKLEKIGQDWYKSNKEKLIKFFQKALVNLS